MNKWLQLFNSYMKLEKVLALKSVVQDLTVTKIFKITMSIMIHIFLATTVRPILLTIFPKPKIEFSPENKMKSS